MLTRNYCRVAASSRFAANSRRCGPPTSICWADSHFYRSGISSYCGELSVLARPVYHHHGAAGSPRRYRSVPVLHLHHAERAGPDGRDHVHGVSTANSILVLSFARERLAEHGDAIRAAIEAGFTRFRPVLMTALAMIIGMIPMALGLGEGGEQNAPLGRAVIGGLMLATVAGLGFVPTLFALLHNRKSSPPPSVSRALGIIRHDALLENLLMPNDLPLNDPQERIAW